MDHPVIALNQALEAEHHDLVRGKSLIFAITREGKVTCSSRDSRRCGVGRSPRQALDDWLDKVMAEGKGSQ